jgi:hypothetical protein
MKSPGPASAVNSSALSGVAEPAHAGTAFDHEENAFQRTVMARAGLGIGTDVHRPGPQFLYTRARKVDGGFAVHAGRLRGVGVQLVGADNADAVVLPAGVGLGGHGGVC